MFARHLIESATITGPGRLTMSIRLNWYRSLPLSCIEDLDVATDTGEASTSLDFSLAAGTWPTHRLHELDHVWWHYTESARLSVDFGRSTDVSVAYLTISTRVPYITDPFGRPAVVIDRSSLAVAR